MAPTEALGCEGRSLSQGTGLLHVGKVAFKANKSSACPGLPALWHVRFLTEEVRGSTQTISETSKATTIRKSREYFCIFFADLAGLPDFFFDFKPPPPTSLCPWTYPPRTWIHPSLAIGHRHQPSKQVHGYNLIGKNAHPPSPWNDTAASEGFTVP